MPNPYHPFPTAEAWHADLIVRVAEDEKLGPVNPRDVPDMDTCVCDRCGSLFLSPDMWTADAADRRYFCHEEGCLDVDVMEYYIQWPELWGALVRGRRVAEGSVGRRTEALARADNARQRREVEAVVKEVKMLGFEERREERERVRREKAGEKVSEMMKRAWKKGRRQDPTNPPRR